MKLFLFFSCIVFFIWSCVPTKRVVGTYGTDYGDTMRVVEDHSWRIELEEPDTVDNKQFKYTTGRWHKKRNKLELHVDSKSHGPYWECLPLKISWNRLRRSIDCNGEGQNYVFKRVNYRKLRRVQKRQEKLEAKREKEKEDEKMKRKLEELEAAEKAEEK